MVEENRFARGALIVLMFLLLAAIGGPQAHAAGGDADLRELQRYTLTLADVRKYAAANAALSKQPKPEQKDEGDEEEDDGNDESLDGMVKRIETVPGARKSIEGAGLSVRQYAVITMSIFQAAFAQYAIEQGADPAKVAKDAGVNPANIRFVKEHKAELEKLKRPGDAG